MADLSSSPLPGFPLEGASGGSSSPDAGTKAREEVKGGTDIGKCVQMQAKMCRQSPLIHTHNLAQQCNDHDYHLRHQHDIKEFVETPGLDSSIQKKGRTGSEGILSGIDETTKN